MYMEHKILDYMMNVPSCQQQNKRAVIGMPDALSVWASTVFVSGGGPRAAVSFFAVDVSWTTQKTTRGGSF